MIRYPQKARKGEANFFYKHGGKGTKTYAIWKRMRARCNNPNSDNYKYYGGAGIKICKRWNQYPNFLKDMGECPPKHSIERRNVRKGYAPSNCYWLPMELQNKNKRNVRKYAVLGGLYNLAEIAKLTGIAYSCLWERIKRMSVEEAITCV